MLPYDLCKLLDVPALEDCVEEVTEGSMAEVDSIQVKGFAILGCKSKQIKDLLIRKQMSAILTDAMQGLRQLAKPCGGINRVQTMLQDRTRQALCEMLTSVSTREAVLDVLMQYQWYIPSFQSITEQSVAATLREMATKLRLVDCIRTRLLLSDGTDVTKEGSLPEV